MITLPGELCWWMICPQTQNLTKQSELTCKLAFDRGRVEDDHQGSKRISYHTLGNLPPLVPTIGGGVPHELQRTFDEAR